MGFPISTNLFRSISESGENLTRGAEILDKEHFFGFILSFRMISEGNWYDI